MSSVLSFGRSAANSRMTETVTAGRFEDGVDEGSGDPILVPVGDPLYTGPARVKYTDTAVSVSDGASQLVASQDVSVSLPSGSVVLPEGTVILVSGSSVDAGLVGRSYRVSGAPTLGQSTAYRFPVTELS